MGVGENIQVLGVSKCGGELASHFPASMYELQRSRLCLHVVDLPHTCTLRIGLFHKYNVIK